MSKLPTVHLRRRRPLGDKGGWQYRKLNATTYALNLTKYVSGGWEIVTTRRGDSPDDVVEFAASQAIKEMARTQTPGHIASKDAQRAFEGQKKLKVRSDTEVVTEEPAEPLTAPTDWRKLPWFARKKYVRDQTGQTPKNVDDAIRIMAEHE